MRIVEEIERIKMEKMKKLLAKQAQLKPALEAPMNVTDANFEASLKQYPLLLVDFWAAWCNPCRIIAPAIEALAKEYAGKVVCAKLNVDVNPITATKFQVFSIPMLLLFKDGRAVERIVGAVPKQQIEAKIRQYL